LGPRNGPRRARRSTGRGSCRREGTWLCLGGGWWRDLLVAGPEQEDELRDYERLCASAEAFVYAAMIRLMVRRLARA